MKSKKADLSITIIIAAVIGLVALVVIIAIFTNTTQKTSENIGSCTAKGGECASAQYACDADHPVKIFVSGNECNNWNDKKLCCLKATN